MSDYLSQDEIDSLLSGLSGDGEAAEGGSSDERYKALTPVFELFCKQASSVLGTAVAKTVDVTPETCAKADFAAAKEKLGADLISLTLSLEAGVEGDMYLLIDKKSAAVLADLMMMGTGAAPYSEECKDAISELFNQVMGAFSTAFGADIGESVSAGNVSVSDFDIANPPFDQDSADMGFAKLTVEGGMVNSAVALLIPNAFGDEIVEKKSPKPAASPMDMGIGISQSEMDELTTMASSSFSGGGGGSYASSPYVPPPPPPRTSTYDGPKENIDLLLDVELDINIELGKSELSIKRVLELAPGSIVELDKMAGEPVDLIVNNKVVAKGEVVVVDENFGIRIVSLVSPADRIKSLK
ncbi:MAG: flagellar motor switch protein FliN [Chitinispirillales bacterium]|nr:flagellar motor switch protein FliN [Chitinispirillales bacterium]